VAFDIDADGILHVSAKDLSTGKEQKIRIEVSSGLNESDIERMIKDAESHKAEDVKRKEEVEIRNQADSLTFQATKALNEYRDKIPSSVASDVQAKIDALKKALEGGDISRIQSAKTDLEASMSHIGEAMSKAHAGQTGSHSEPPPGGGPQDSAQKPDIEEAEVEIIDNEEKKKNS
jgi:molecular chaperone DnaK